MSKKKTEWFPAAQKPELVGVYERRLKHRDGRYSYWDGKRWGCASISVDNALLAGITISSSWQTTAWRGLANKPDSA